MTIFQMIMLAISAFFAYKVYEHIMRIEEGTPEGEEEQKLEITKAQSYISQADKAFEDGDIVECKKLLREALYLDRENIELMLKLAYLESESENYEDAISYAKDALAVDEKSDEAYAALGSFYRAKKLYKEAQECYEKAIALDADHPYYYFNYANLLVDMGEIERAKEMYKKAIELDAEFMQAKFELEKLSNETA